MKSANLRKPIVESSVRWAVRMPGARLVTVNVAAEQTGGAYTLLEVEVLPGGGEWAHVQHREDECLYVVEGEFALLDEDRTLRAGPGSLAYVPKGYLHAYENAGEVRAGCSSFIRPEARTSASSRRSASRPTTPPPNRPPVRWDH